MSPQTRRWTACCVSALLVLLVPLASAEGEYWKEPDTLTFPGGGSLAAGRVENLLDQDGRTMKLSDSTGTGIAWQFVEPTADVPPQNTWNPFGCTEHFDCVNDPPLGDGNTSYLTNSTDDSNERLVIDNPKDSIPAGTTLLSLSVHIVGRTSGTSSVVFFLAHNITPGDEDFCQFSNGFNTWPSTPDYDYHIFPSNSSGYYTSEAQWASYGYPGISSCDGTPISELISPVNLIISHGGALLRVTTLGIGAVYGEANVLTADLSLGATGFYPIRAEWTCTARTGGPYYLGALNATGGTRWFNVTRDAGGNYPSGEMCAVPGTTERYHASMTAADFGPDGRVHFRIADNSSDPQGSAWGNITLDRLVAILTQDFAVSVESFGWLVYLGFITVGLLIAAFAYHRWREHGSST